MHSHAGFPTKVSLQNRITKKTFPPIVTQVLSWWELIRFLTHSSISSVYISEVYR